MLNITEENIRLSAEFQAILDFIPPLNKKGEYMTTPPGQTNPVGFNKFKKNYVRGYKAGFKACLDLINEAKQNETT